MSTKEIYTLDFSSEKENHVRRDLSAIVPRTNNILNQFMSCKYFDVRCTISSIKSERDCQRDDIGWYGGADCNPKQYINITVYMFILKHQLTNTEYLYILNVYIYKEQLSL